MGGAAGGEINAMAVGGFGLSSQRGHEPTALPEPPQLALAACRREVAACRDRCRGRDDLTSARRPSDRLPVVPAVAAARAVLVGGGP